MDVLKTLGLAFYHWIEAIILFFVPRQLRLKDISKDVVLITGAGNGIGRLLALKLANEVESLVLWDIDEHRLQETGREVTRIGGKCKCYVVDISDRNKVYSTAEKIKQDVGTVSVVINNAGIVSGKPILELSDEAILKTFEVNVFSHFWINKAFLPGMMEKNKGHIITMASVASFVGSDRLTDYSASKAAAYMLQEALFLELATDGYDGIKVTSVCPYFIDTGMFQGVHDKVIPMLKPDYAADKIIEAYRTDQFLIVLPRFFYFMNTIKTIIPAKTGFYLYSLLGGLSMMKTFAGRNNNVDNGKVKSN
ncbi:short-chain dehydrogenase/reductase family 16C member 6-like [Panonychus citri]|uniref:short-chain dehydrogenase/reductase family 16C member 6-like n=1 Tax=Panonychus citri TaxID=50023 RepID=UPI00230815FE|nr:short-chain dehydrogenase/reductase family 16C member 6-like [Panonychus citri]XP_053208341.1 short-chain dehydrogenase/reductase family 16C member 6-like [Panonychus citri]